ncbi:MAG: DinB family protein [Nocardioidaceae bacterium]
MSDGGADAVVEERESLLFFLNRVREALVRTSEGLAEVEQRAAGVPSGTNLLGLLSHLTAMEVHWFRGVFLGEAVDRDISMQVPEGELRGDVVAAYQEVCADSDRIVRACDDLSALSKQDARVPASSSGDADPGVDLRVSLRRIVAHMIEETARHAGHADILREQIDGATDL